MKPASRARTPTLEAIAQNTGLTPAFFSRPPGPQVPFGSLLFRARRSIAHLDEDQAHAWTELVVDVRHSLGSWDRATLSSSSDPMEAAAETRSALGLGPYSPVPNLIYLLEEASVIVLALPLHLPKRDAFTTWVDDAPVIVIPSGAPGDRLRFSVAHELAHVVLDRGKRGFSPDVEARADLFAAEFLTPRVAMEAELVRPVTIELLLRLRARWGVSAEMIVRRAVELGIISKRWAQTLHMRLAILRRDGRIEPLFVEKPRALRKFAEEQIGPTRTAQILATNIGLQPEMAAAILNAHASRQELLETVPSDAASTEKLLPFTPRPSGS